MLVFCPPVFCARDDPGNYWCTSDTIDSSIGATSICASVEVTEERRNQTDDVSRGCMTG